jgi:hypothetical protein
MGTLTVRPSSGFQPADARDLIQSIRAGSPGHRVRLGEPIKRGRGPSPATFTQLMELIVSSDVGKMAIGAVINQIVGWIFGYIREPYEGKPKNTKRRIVVTIATEAKQLGDLTVSFDPKMGIVRVRETGLNTAAQKPRRSYMAMFDAMWKKSGLGKGRKR